MKSETGYDAYFAGQLDLAPIVLRKYIINMIAICLLYTSDAADE